tara:strand:- start:2311 stop:2547 length:237 start_codon:yes stop_codon:yes gene_type:complete
MTIANGVYRLIGLDGRPHKVLDAPYESIEAALSAASNWCDGQGLKSSFIDRAIGVEVMTVNGSWRTVCYPQKKYSSQL